LRDLTSPESREFIAKLEKGEVPAGKQFNFNKFVMSDQLSSNLVELTSNTAPRGPGPHHVDINLSDKRSEDYVPPPPPAYVAFSGGNSLGSSSSSSASGSAFTPASLSAVEVPSVDESQPSTTLQVRMHDGRKLKIK
jgi:UBX domain-containing protein 1